MACRWRGWRPLLLCRPRRAVRVVATALACTSVCFVLTCLLLLSSSFQSPSSYSTPPISHYEYYFSSWNMLSPLLNLSSFFAHAHWSGERAQLAFQPAAVLPNEPMTNRATAVASNSKSRGNRKNDSSISSSYSGHSSKFDVREHVDSIRVAPNERSRVSFRVYAYSRAFPFSAASSIATSATTQTRTLKRTTSTRAAATTVTKTVTTKTTTTNGSLHNTSRHALPAHTDRIPQSQRAMHALLEWLQWRAKYLLPQTSLLDTDPLNCVPTVEWRPARVTEEHSQSARTRTSRLCTRPQLHFSNAVPDTAAATALPPDSGLETRQPNPIESESESRLKARSSPRPFRPVPPVPSFTWPQRALWELSTRPQMVRRNEQEDEGKGSVKDGEPECLIDTDLSIERLVQMVESAAYNDSYTASTSQALSVDWFELAFHAVPESLVRAQRRACARRRRRLDSSAQNRSTEDRAIEQTARESSVCVSGKRRIQKERGDEGHLKLALVSAFFTLEKASKFASSRYLTWLRAFRHMRNPLVFFSDAPAFLTEILELRSWDYPMANNSDQLKHNSSLNTETQSPTLELGPWTGPVLPLSLTRAFQVERSKLPAFRLYEEPARAVLARARGTFFPESPSTMNADYCLTMYAKYDLVALAVANLDALFPAARSSHVAWLDVGYFRDLAPEAARRPALAKPTLLPASNLHAKVNANPNSKQAKVKVNTESGSGGGAKSKANPLKHDNSKAMPPSERWMNRTRSSHSPAAKLSTARPARARAAPSRSAPAPLSQQPQPSLWFLAPLAELDAARVAYSQVYEVDARKTTPRDVVHWCRNWVAGGFFVATLHTMRTWLAQYRFFAEWLLARGLVRTDQQVLLAMQTPEARAAAPFTFNLTTFSTRRAPGTGSMPASQTAAVQAPTARASGLQERPRAQKVTSSQAGDEGVVLPFVEIQGFLKRNGWMYLGNQLRKRGEQLAKELERHQ